MNNDNVLYLFTKPLNDHLESLSVNERYIALRVERFTEEFLDNEMSFDQIETIIACIHDYLVDCEDMPELNNTLINLKQSIFWLNEYSKS